MSKLLKSFFSIILIAILVFSPIVISAQEVEPADLASYSTTTSSVTDNEYPVIRSGDGHDVETDWVFVRRYESTEPTFSSAGSEESLSQGGGGGGGPVIQNISYTYDAVGNITQIVDYSDSGTGKSLTYTYDDLHRLTFASTTAASSTPFLQAYSYNPLGNITGWKSGASTSTYSYAETGYTNPHAPTSIGGVSLAYDNNGNLTSYGSKLYAWDYRNRLASSTESGIGTTYSYDHNNQRVKKTTSGTTTYYPNQYFEKVGATTTRYIYAGDELIATLVGNGSATSTYYIHPDHLNSTHVMTNASGTPVRTYDFYPYGDERIDTGTATQNHKYIGIERDTETGLDYAKARYYDNTRGQFTGQDPSFLDIGAPQFKQKYERTLEQHLTNPQALNSYSWALNNPIIYKDPEGEIVPLLLAAYAAFEIGLSAYDAYTTAQTIADPNSSFGEKAVTGALFVAGTVLPGGGYSQAPKLVDKAGDAVRAVDKVNDISRSAETADKTRNGIIYLRTDQTGNISKPYVGQTKSETRFLERQKEHQRVNPTSRFDFRVIDRGIPGSNLNAKEQKYIDQLGGPTNKSNPDGGTSNRKNVIRQR